MKKIEKNRFYHMDCRDGMHLMKPKSVDLIPTDPSFAIEFNGLAANYHRKSSNVVKQYVETKKEDYLPFTIEWLFLAKYILKDSGSLYLFASWNNLEETLSALKISGFTVINHIIWKYQFGVRTARKFTTSHYHILYCCKKGFENKIYFNRNCRFKDSDKDDNGRSLRYKDMEDVWFIKREYWRNKKKTATKLPSELLKKIILYSSKKGDLVLDPFLGSGNFAVVCKKLNRNFLGFEISRPIYNFAVNHLKNSGNV